MRILIVEDEYRLARMIGDCLEKENYIADIALNGADGLYKAKTAIYDIVILDVMLPQLNGFEVLRKIREKDKQLPILILTAKSELDDKLFGLDSGADDYMTKPFEMKELLARVRVLVRRSKRVEEQGIGYEDLQLVQRQLKLHCTESGQSVELGTKEYSLMEYLMVNANQILSKEQISNKIWGYESSVEYNNAEVYVSFLRKKLTFLESKVRIKTVRGVGYRLESEGETYDTTA